MNNLSLDNLGENRIHDIALTIATTYCNSYPEEEKKQIHSNGGYEVFAREFIKVYEEAYRQVSLKAQQTNQEYNKNKFLSF